ncbi:hypothetical protein C8J55DRAFT_557746 [Lentinula edodes]|uniref:Uncharacterized protein n=1 Tax=Lentinula lateritia TaxID=40482 RepID=A0A9W9AU61_9AGAR|nr:hypothetical protein C8J55DRAFT_557746 [Lentinula edodes]
MPEQREPRAMEVQIKHAIAEAQEEGSSFSAVHALWIDATSQEAKKSPLNSRFRNHLVDRIDASCAFKRGQKDNQTPIYPPQLSITKKGPEPEPITTLGLQGPQSVSSTARSLILDLGPLKLMFSFLTHCNVNLYQRRYWEDTISVLSWDDRHWSVALAFEFNDHFLAFISLDNLFQILNSTKLEERLAIKVIRDMKSLHGAGVYTSLELFAMAGVSPFLSAAEVFRNLSRTARLLDAYWCYCQRTHSDELWTKLLRPAVHHGVLAPTVDQRLQYRNWLCVYAKDNVLCTPREATLIDNYVDALAMIGSSPEPFVRSGDDVHLAGLHDVFEPNRIRSALERSELNLGHLIFTESRWHALGGPLSSMDDPITKMFERRGLLDSTTFLHNEIYETLFVDSTGLSRRTTYSYHATKQFWSITPCFPPNLFHDMRAVRAWNITYTAKLEVAEVAAREAQRRKRTSSRSVATDTPISLNEAIALARLNVPSWPTFPFTPIVGAE